MYPPVLTTGFGDWEGKLRRGAQCAQAKLQCWTAMAEITRVIFDTYMIGSLVFQDCQVTGNSYWGLSFEIAAGAAYMSLWK